MILLRQKRLDSILDFLYTAVVFIEAEIYATIIVLAERSRTDTIGLCPPSERSRWDNAIEPSDPSGTS